MRAQADRFTGRPDVLRTVGGECTTAELVATERRLIAAAVDRAGERTGLRTQKGRRTAYAAYAGVFTTATPGSIPGPTGPGF